jgi:hypothetical protein
MASLADFDRSYRAILESNLRQFVAVPEQPPAIYSVTQAKTHRHGIAEYCRSATRISTCSAPWDAPRRNTSCSAPRSNGC